MEEIKQQQNTLPLGTQPNKFTHLNGSPLFDQLHQPTRHKTFHLITAEMGLLQTSLVSVRAPVGPNTEAYR